MGFQFVHLESFGRKGDGMGRSTSFIFAEARRDPAESTHVPKPSPPTVVFGVSIGEVEVLHDAAADAARTVPKAGSPRRLRQDHKTLHTVIASHPYTMEEIRSDPSKRAECETWERRTVDWLRKQYGADLKSVVRHEDESHFHVHAFVVPSDDPEMRALRHHPGVVAKRAAMATVPADAEDSKATSKRGDVAYKSAMRAWQDAYHEAVGIPCGLARLGPRRRNLPRGEWQREKSQAKALQAALDRASIVKTKIETHIVTKAAEVELLVSSAVAEVAALKAQADAATTEAGRRLAEAKAATDAAKAAHDAALREQARARGMMFRVRQEAARVKAAAARLQRLPSVLRTVFDGFRESRVAERIRTALETDMALLRERASSALERAAAADADRRAAEERARNLDVALSETAAQRDAARREVRRLRPPEPTPGPGIGPRLRPTPKIS